MTDTDAYAERIAHDELDAAWEKWEEFGYDESPTGDVVFVEAHNGSGSRYVVVASAIPESCRMACGGAEVMVALWYPWSAVYPMRADGILALSYIGEKFAKTRGVKWSPTDLAGVAQTIGRALGREVFRG